MSACRDCSDIAQATDTAEHTMERGRKTTSQSMSVIITFTVKYISFKNKDDYFSVDKHMRFDQATCHVMCGEDGGQNGDK